MVGKLAAGEEEFPSDAPLEAYLQLAWAYYRADKLDLAMKVVNDAFENKGWHPGAWTAFYNELACEAAARDASVARRADDLLSIELRSDAPPDQYESIARIALQARAQVSDLLHVAFQRPVLVTILLPDAPVEFIVGSYGYVTPKDDIDKICLPDQTVASEDVALDALVHEFTHVAVHQLAGDRVPAWLNEGLATYASGDLDTRQSRFVIETAARSGKLLKLSRIQSLLNSGDARKDEPAQVNAAYYLSASFVAHWIERFGIDSVRNAFVRIGDGEDPEKAIARVTGVALNSMEREWRDELRQSR